MVSIVEFEKLLNLQMELVMAGRIGCEVNKLKSLSVPALAPNPWFSLGLSLFRVLHKEGNHEHRLTNAASLSITRNFGCTITRAF